MRSRSNVPKRLMYWVSQNLSFRASGLRHLGELGKRFGSFGSEAPVSTSSAWPKPKPLFFAVPRRYFRLNACPAPAFLGKNIDNSRESTGPFASFGSVSGSYSLRY